MARGPAVALDRLEDRSVYPTTFHTPPSTCDWTVKKGSGRVTRPTGVACRTLLDEQPDASSADVGTAEAVGGWKHWPALFASQAVGVVAAGVVAGVMLQTPVAAWADVAAGCVWAGLSTGLYDRLVDGRFNVYQVSDGIINCLVGAVGTALVTRVSEVVSTAAGALRTQVNAAMARFWRGSQAADVEFGPGLEMVLMQVGSGVTRQGPPGLGYFAGLPGGAKDIAAYGRHVWIIGTTPEGGGYSDGHPWIVNSFGQIFLWK